jgi:hypothetical protein
MLNEGQVTLLWERLFQKPPIDKGSLSRAGELIEELRPESPLRFRLERELAEIRTIHAI